MLEKVKVRLEDVTRRLARRKKKMDELGFLSAEHNQARADAMLKLEVRKRVRVEDLKREARGEMWQERAKVRQAPPPPRNSH